MDDCRFVAKITVMKTSKIIKVLIINMIINFTLGTVTITEQVSSTYSVRTEKASHIIQNKLFLLNMVLFRRH
jgi:hypothetical protein